MALFESRKRHYNEAFDDTGFAPDDSEERFLKVSRRGRYHEFGSQPTDGKDDNALAVADDGAGAGWSGTNYGAFGGVLAPRQFGGAFAGQSAFDSPNRKRRRDGEDENDDELWESAFKRNRSQQYTPSSPPEGEELFDPRRPRAAAAVGGGAGAMVPLASGGDVNMLDEAPLSEDASGEVLERALVPFTKPFQRVDERVGTPPLPAAAWLAAGRLPNNIDLSTLPHLILLPSPPRLLPPPEPNVTDMVRYVPPPDYRRLLITRGDNAGHRIEFCADEAEGEAEGEGAAMQGDEQMTYGDGEGAYHGEDGYGGDYQQGYEYQNGYNQQESGFGGGYDNGAGHGFGQYSTSYDGYYEDGGAGGEEMVM